jgi:hypothetical protein
MTKRFYKPKRLKKQAFLRKVERLEYVYGGIFNIPNDLICHETISKLNKRRIQSMRWDWTINPCNEVFMHGSQPSSHLHALELEMDYRAIATSQYDPG